MANARTKNEIGSLLLTVIVLAVLVLANLVGLKKFTRLDLTENKAYSLSESTKFLMRNLPDQLLVKVYFTPNLPAPFSINERYLRDLLSEYHAYAGGRMKYEYLNPASSEEVRTDASNHGIRELQLTKIENDQIGQQIAYMGVVFYYRDKTETLPFIQSVDNLEYEITSAIKRVTSVSKKTIGFYEGHGGGDPQTGLMPLKDALGKAYSPRIVEIKDGAVEDCDVLVVAGPKETMPDGDLYAIDQHIMKGGNVAFLAPQVQPDLQSFQGRPIASGIENLAASYGVKIGKDLVKDMQATIISVRSPGMPFPLPVRYPFIPMVGDFHREHLITRTLQQMSLAFVSSLTLDEAILSGQGTKGTVLVRSSPKSWLQEGFFFLDPTKITPPLDESVFKTFNLAVALEGRVKSHFADKGAPSFTDAEGNPVVLPEPKLESPASTRILVVGSDSLMQMQGEDDPAFTFFANAIDWLAADNDLISIRSKSVGAPPIGEVSEGLKDTLKYANMIGLPALVILLGLFRWYWLGIRRRRVERQWSANAG